MRRRKQLCQRRSKLLHVEEKKNTHTQMIIIMANMFCSHFGAGWHGVCDRYLFDTIYTYKLTVVVVVDVDAVICVVRDRSNKE